MRKSTLLVFMCFALLFLACANASEKPKEVALAYINALESKDFETAKKYCTKNTKEIIGIMATTSYGRLGDKPSKYVVISEEIKGDTAVVKLKNDMEGIIEVKLKKVNDKWLVSDFD